MRFGKRFVGGLRLAGFVFALCTHIGQAASESVKTQHTSRRGVLQQPLIAGWKLQSACIVKATGDQLSSPQYSPDGWIRAIVPGTVLGSQVHAGIFADPFFGMNLRQIPGTDYPIEKVFGYLPMSDASPYRCAWWYRTEFATHAATGRAIWLHFDGINYRANLWLNGKQIATSEQVAGAFRSHDFDVTNAVVRGRQNVLAIEVFAQTEKDLGIDFLDWNPSPADKSMGLWRDVSLATTGPVTVANPEVVTHFTSDDLSQAELRVVVDVANHGGHPLTASVDAQVGSAHVKQQVSLAANEARVLSFDAEHFPQLLWKNPPVWWPYQYGDSPLETLRVSAKIDGVVSDTKTARFGVREVQSSLNESGALQFRVNHRSILIRGGGWTPNLFYFEPKERIREELAYVKHMHLNTIRLEGKLGSDALFDIADKMGILIIAGWQCCDYWQKWDQWTLADHAIANASTYSQISRLRAHPSVLVWLNGSDEAPSAQAEKETLAVLKERDWPNPILSAAADRISTITGKSGVKMSGPYDYVPPEYWYLDKDRLGGAFGFNTETGPGPAIPPVSSIQRTLPRDSWWPIDEQWKYHAALGKFAQYNSFNRAMDATYGEAKSLADYSLKAQLVAYDGERAMFEAYGANKYHSTGVIQWMLNNAWPSFVWHLYDYYLVPGGGYFGTRKANEPLHIQYRYDDRRVVVVNSTLKAYEDLRATVRLFDLNGRQLFAQMAPLQVDADGVADIVTLPTQTATTFLRLDLRDASGEEVSENLYWIPAKLAQLDWDKSTYVNTPAIAYADMRDLSHLAPATVKLAVSELRHGEATVRLTNMGKTFAFFLALHVVKHGTDQDVAPVFWDDNYISLLPAESKTLTVRGLPVNGNGVDIQLSGWNVAAATQTPVEKLK